jgi:hypothetical protein
MNRSRKSFRQTNKLKRSSLPAQRIRQFGVDSQNIAPLERFTSCEMMPSRSEKQILMGAGPPAL